MLRAVGFGAAWCLFRAIRLLLFELREAVAFRAAVFFEVRVEVFFPLTELRFSLPTAFFLAVVFFVTLE